MASTAAAMWGSSAWHGGGDGGVFVVDDGEHVEGGEGVDVLGGGVAGFGGEVGELLRVFHGGVILHDCFMMAQAGVGRNVSEAIRMGWGCGYRVEGLRWRCRQRVTNR